MTLLRTVCLLFLIALAITACGKEESPEAAKAAPGAAASDSNPLLALVPADTPYLAGNLAPVPDAIIDAYLQRFEPALASMQSQFSKARAELESQPEKLAADSELRIAHALLLELDGNLSRPGLESLGLDLSSNSVVYGISVFPVIRYELADAATLKATVQRVLENAQVTAPEFEFQGQKYWRFIPEVEASNDDDNDADIGSEEGAESESADASKELQIGIYLAILPDQLVMALLPPSAEATLLPSLLAKEKPSNSNAEATLQNINQRYSYSPYGSGTVDFQKLADELTNTQSLAGQILTQAGEDMSVMSTEVCRQELRSIIAKAPRAVSGITDLTTNSVASQMVIETEPTLAGEMMGLVSDVPAANAQTTYLAEFAMGLKVGPVRDFLRNKAKAMVEAPYQCESFLPLNQAAQRAVNQLNQPIPPMVNNLLGMRIALSRLGRDLMSPGESEGLFALHVTQPEMFVGMAQMLLPGLAELNLTPGEPPVQVPPEMLPLPGMVLYAAQSAAAIGLSVGEGQQNSLIDFINKEGGKEDGGANGVFLSANYDAAAIKAITDSLGGDNSVDEVDKASDVAKEFQKIYEQMAGRNDFRFSFSKDGFVIDTGTTFKNP